MQEARELANDPCTDYSAAPLEVRSFSIGQWWFLTLLLLVPGRYLRKYILALKNMSLSSLLRIGMALHSTWSHWHWIWGRPLSFSHSSSRRISISSTLYHDAHSEWQIWTQLQGICWQHSSSRAFIDMLYISKICISFTSCKQSFGRDIVPGLTSNGRSWGTLAARMGCADGWVTLIILTSSSNCISLSYYWSSRLLSSKGAGCSRRWVHRISCGRKEKIGLSVIIVIKVFA